MGRSRRLASRCCSSSRSAYSSSHAFSAHRCGTPTERSGARSSLHSRSWHASSANHWQFVAVGGLALGSALALFVWAGVDLATGYVLVPGARRGADPPRAGRLCDLPRVRSELARVWPISAAAHATHARALAATASDRVGYRPGQSGLVLVALGWSLEVQAAGVWVRWLGSLLE